MFLFCTSVLKQLLPPKDNFGRIILCNIPLLKVNKTLKSYTYTEISKVPVMYLHKLFVSFPNTLTGMYVLVHSYAVSILVAEVHVPNECHDKATKLKHWIEIL